jgi:hypothetical protein
MPVQHIIVCASIHAKLYRYITLHRTLYVDYVKYTQYEVLRQTLENCTGTDMFYCVYVAMMHPSGKDVHIVL